MSYLHPRPPRLSGKRSRKRSFTNILKKFNVTVLKTDVETGKKPQGDASLAGAVYGIYKGEELVDTYTTDEKRAVPQRNINLRE